MKTFPFVKTFPSRNKRRGRIQKANKISKLVFHWEMSFRQMFFEWYGNEDDANHDHDEEIHPTEHSSVFPDISSE